MIFKRQMSEEHENSLKAMLGIAQDDQHPLPEFVVEQYWIAKRAAERIGLTMSLEMVHSLAMRFWDQLAEEDHVGFLQWSRVVGVEFDDDIEVKHRGKWCKAFYRGEASGDKILAQIADDDQAETREFTEDRVRFPERELAEA